jgi:hypothetical protein
MLIPETITRITPGAPTGLPDAMGEPILSADVSTDIEIKAFAPRFTDPESAETYGVRVISGGTVYGYRGTALTPQDRLIIRGLTYQVDGESGDWLSPYPNSPEGIEFSVKRAT